MLLKRCTVSTSLIYGDHGDAWGEDGLWEHSIFHQSVHEVPLILHVNEDEDYVALFRERMAAIMTIRIILARENDRKLSCLYKSALEEARSSWQAVEHRRNQLQYELRCERQLRGARTESAAV